MYLIVNQANSHQGSSTCNAKDILMEDHARDQASARAEPDGARVLPRRSTRADAQDPGFKYTAWCNPPGEFSPFLALFVAWDYLCVCGRVFPVFWALPSTHGPFLGPLEGF